MKPSIRTIAEITGLSLATVSKYLNGKSILPENEKKIADAIQSVHYMPDMNAQALRSNKSKIIAIVIYDIGSIFWGRAINYIQEKLSEQNFLTAVYVIKQDQREKSLQYIVQQNPRGIILVPLDQNDTSYTFFNDRNIPIIVLDQRPADGRFDCITSANYDGAYKATEYLLKSGHTELGLICGIKNSYTTTERLNGFMSACRDWKITIKNEFISNGTASIASGVEQFKNIMQRPNRPEALFALGYDVGLGALIEANTEQLQIGKDFSLIIFDDNEIFAGSTPPVTVVAQDLKTIGEEAAFLLIQRMQKPEIVFKPQTYMIPTFFIERDSVYKRM